MFAVGSAAFYLLLHPDNLIQNQHVLDETWGESKVGLWGRSGDGVSGSHLVFKAGLAPQGVWWAVQRRCADWARRRLFIERLPLCLLPPPALQHPDITLKAPREQCHKETLSHSYRSSVIYSQFVNRRDVMRKHLFFLFVILITGLFYDMSNNNKKNLTVHSSECQTTFCGWEILKTQIER